MKAHVAAFFRTTPLSCMFYNTSGGRHTRFKCDWSSDVCSSDLVSSAQTKTHTRPAEETPAAGDGSARYSIRSEERRVGKEGKSRWSPYQLKDIDEESTCTDKLLLFVLHAVLPVDAYIND